MPMPGPNRLLALLCLLSIIVTPRALADGVPDPPNNRVSPCDELNGMVLAPNSPNPAPASEIQVLVVNNANDPIPNASVVVELWVGPIQLCPNGVFTATTDAQGIAYLTLAGGGCRAGVALAGVIKANGVAIRNYENVKSPDFDGAGSDLVVNLADLVQFSAEFLGDAPAVCHDYDNNGATNLGDLIIFAPTFTDGATCP
ncbi:MAG: hypothetical protein R3E97_09420 [Candidatus Eisenbacteria bacterium]